MIFYPQEFQKTCLSDLVQLLTLLRSSYNAEDVVSTHTQLSLEYPGRLLPNIQKDQVDAQKIVSETNLDIEYSQASYDLLSDELQELVDFVNEFSAWEVKLKNPGLRFAPRLRQMVLRIQAVFNTPGYDGLVDDMLDFVRWAVNEAADLMIKSSKASPLAPVTVGLRDKYHDFEVIGNAFSFGIEQRMSGAQFGISNPAHAYAGIHGLGIQRMLSASSAIPHAVLSVFENLDTLVWQGFTVFGFQNDTLVLPCGVINLPAQEIMAPSEWWRLGHETGHIFVMATHLLEAPVIENLVQNLDKGASKKILRRMGINSEELVEELVANVFEYYFCFRGDFDLYLETVWQFLNQYLEGQDHINRLTEFVFRSVFTFLFHLEQNGALPHGQPVEEIILSDQKHLDIFMQRSLDEAMNQRTLMEENSLEHLIFRAVFLPIIGIADRLNHALRRISIDEIVALYRACEPLRSDLFNMFDLCGAPNPVIPNVSTQLKKIGKKLVAGKIIELDDPLDVYLLPLSLQYWKNENNRAVPMPARIAALLSLWHWDQKM